MSVKVIEGSGTTVCPPHFYALYEGSDYNEANSADCRVLVADEPVADLATYDFDHAAQSLVNHSHYTVALYAETDRAGEHLDVEPTRCLQSLNAFKTATGERWGRRATATATQPGG